MIGKYGLFVVFSLLAVLACPPVLASEVGEYELVATWGSLGADDGRFNHPTGIVVNGEGNVYVADSSNRRIQKFDSTGAFLLKWGSEGSGEGEFYSLQDVALDADGRVYVVDNSCIQVFDSNGTFLKKWGLYGSGEEQLQSPRSIAFDADNNAYVVVGSGIKKFDSEGNFLTSWGVLGIYDGEFNNPVDVEVDAAGNVYVADSSNNRIQKFAGMGTFLLKWGSQGSGEGQFQQPSGLTIDTDGNVYVTEWSRPVQKFDSCGNLLVKTTGTLYGGEDIAVGADGTVYVTDSYSDCIRVFEQTSTLTPTPKVVLDIVLNDSRTYSVDGRSVSRGTPLAFELTNNLNGFSNLDVAAQPAIKIDVTLPGGGATNQFGGMDLTAIPINGTTAYMGPVNLADATAGTYTAQARWPSTSDFYGKGLDSNTVTFEVTTGALGITSNKDSVVRGNSFTVTITGESGKAYNLFITNPSNNAAENPTFRAGQVGVRYNATDATNVTVTTTAAGTRSVELNTNQSTKAASYTIRVADPLDASKYDEVRVRIEQGSITITFSGTGVYYIGEELTLSGTNTDSSTTYLFLTGPNLPLNGVRLDGDMLQVENNNAASFASAGVEADDTWSYKWDTSAIARSLDAGGYTIYAVAEPQGKNNLTGVRYATQTIQLRHPFVTATASAVTVTKGDSLTIFGHATGDPSNVYIWIFGKNFYGHANGELAVQSVRVESDSTFYYEILNTENFIAGQYFVIVQHPMGARFEVAPGSAALGQDPNSIYRADQTGATNMFVARLTSLQATEAANALIDALESPYVDDAYTKFSFWLIEEHWIQIDPISDPNYGENFTVTGTTDYPAGTVLTYGVIPKYEESSLFGTMLVTDDGDWSFEVDTTTIGPGAFTLRVTAPGYWASATAAFDIYDEVTHPAPPAGATYRVERISVIPSLGDLAPGEEAALYGTISAPWTGNRGSLEFSTDLKNPTWSCSIVRDGVEIYTRSQNARSLTLTAFELDYGQDIQVHLTLEGTVPETGAEDSILLMIFERGADGRNIPESEYRLAFTPAGDDPTPPPADNLTLAPGWNFISIPRPLAAENNTATIFAGVKANGHSIFRYDTANKTWIPLQETDRLAPLEGFWIYSTGPAVVPLNFSIDPIATPPERSLSAGWNAVGAAGSTPATARDALYSVRGEWSTLIGYNAAAQVFETGIVNGGSGANADARSVYPGRGYWLHMAGPGTLCAIGV